MDYSWQWATDVEPAERQALADAVTAAGRERGSRMASASAEKILRDASHAAADLVSREQRKGRQSAKDLDTFARRYGSAKDAANYQERRFARSRHQRKTEAAERAIVTRLVAELGLAGPVLDAPCGAGRFFTIFLDAGGSAVGVDVSTEMLGLARGQLEDRGRPFASRPRPGRPDSVQSGSFPWACWRGRRLCFAEP